MQKNTMSKFISYIFLNSSCLNLICVDAKETQQNSNVEHLNTINNINSKNANSTYDSDYDDEYETKDDTNSTNIPISYEKHENKKKHITKNNKLNKKKHILGVKSQNFKKHHPKKHIKALTKSNNLNNSNTQSFLVHKNNLNNAIIGINKENFNIIIQKLHSLYNWKDEIKPMLKDFISEIYDDDENNISQLIYKYFYNISKEDLKILVDELINVQKKYEESKNKEGKDKYKDELEKTINSWIQNADEQVQKKLQILCNKYSKNWINKEKLVNNLKEQVLKTQKLIEEFLDTTQISNPESLSYMKNIYEICGCIFNNMWLFTKDYSNRKLINQLLEVTTDLQQKIESTYTEKIPTEIKEIASNSLEVLSDIIFGCIYYNLVLYDLDEINRSSKFKKFFKTIKTGLILIGLDCTKNAVLFSDIKTPIKIPYLNINFINSLSPKFCNLLMTNKGFAEAIKNMPKANKKCLLNILLLQQKILQKKISIITIKYQEKKKNLYNETFLNDDILKDIQTLKKTVYSLQLVSQIIISLQEFIKDQLSISEIKNIKFLLEQSASTMSFVKRDPNFVLANKNIIAKIDNEIEVLEYISKPRSSTNISHACRLLINYLNKKSLLQNFDKYFNRIKNTRSLYSNSKINSICDSVETPIKEKTEQIYKDSETSSKNRTHLENIDPEIIKKYLPNFLYKI